MKKQCVGISDILPRMAMISPFEIAKAFAVYDCTIKQLTKHEDTLKVATSGKAAAS